MLALNTAKITMLDSWSNEAQETHCLNLDLLHQVGLFRGGLNKGDQRLFQLLAWAKRKHRAFSLQVAWPVVAIKKEVSESGAF